MFGRPPSRDDDLRRLNHSLNLRDHDSLDLGCRHTAKSAGGGASPIGVGRDVITVKLAAFPAVGRRHDGARRAEDQTFQNSWRASQWPLGARSRACRNQLMNLFPEVFVDNRVVLSRISRALIRLSEVAAV